MEGGRKGKKWWKGSSRTCRWLVGTEGKEVERMKIYDADCQKQAIRYITGNYLNAPTRRGCFFLVGQYGSGKSWVMRKLASQYGVDLINLNLYLAQSLQREADFDKLIRFNSKKINTLFRGYLKRLF